MRNALLKLFISVVPILIVFVSGCTGADDMRQTGVKGKSALLIIASQNFRDEEYFDTKKVLEQRGVLVTTASKKAGHVRGMLGGTANASLGLADVNAGDYDAVVFIGGSGAQEYFNDSVAHDIAQSANEGGKVVAAICIAPVILAKAGLLEGKKATCFDGVYSSQLESMGALFTSEDVVIDGNIITANGPAAARDFGNAIVRSLEEK